MHGGVGSLSCKLMDILSLFEGVVHLYGVQNVKLRTICFQLMFASDVDLGCCFWGFGYLFPGGLCWKITLG
jgi:hypothetical protein